MDLSAGVKVTQTGTAMERDSVYILTVSVLSQMDETLRQWCALVHSERRVRDLYCRIPNDALQEHILTKVPVTTYR